MGQAHNRLVHALSECKYQDTKTFTVNNGFAVLTKLERITDSGKSAKRERWSTIKLTPFCLSDYFISLFWGTEGRFRVILFIVTPLFRFNDNGQSWSTANDAYALHQKGDSVLAKEQQIKIFTGKHIHFLIYEFNNKNNSEPNLIRPGYSSLTAMEQLKATEIIKNL